MEAKNVKSWQEMVIFKLPEHQNLINRQAEIAFKAGILEGKGRIIDNGNKLLTKFPEAAKFWQLLVNQSIYGKTS